MSPSEGKTLILLGLRQLPFPVKKRFRPERFLLVFSPYRFHDDITTIDNPRFQTLFTSWWIAPKLQNLLTNKIFSHFECFKILCASPGLFFLFVETCEYFIYSFCRLFLSIPRDKPNFLILDYFLFLCFSG